MLDLQLPARIARVRKLWRVMQINWILSGPSVEIMSAEEIYLLVDEREQLQKELEKSLGGMK